MVENKSLRRDFGLQVLRAMREDAGITLMELSNRTDISKDTIFNWETGRSCPDMLQFKILSQACEIDWYPYVNRFYSHRCKAGPGFDAAPIHAAVDRMCWDDQQRLAYVLCHPLWRVFLNLMICHIQLPLRGRIPSASLLVSLHKVADLKQSFDPDCPEPDMAYILGCLQAGEAAIEQGKQIYTIGEEL